MRVWELLAVFEREQTREGAAAVRAVGDAIEERRAAAWYEVKEAAVISASRVFDFDSFEGFVTEVSRFGICFRGPREIYAGTEVRVGVENAVVFGKVRYCRRIDDAFESGIQIEQVTLRSAALPEETDAPENCLSRREPVEILLVEDNPADVKLTIVMLQDMSIPHNLTIATDGAEALKFLDSAEPKPDLVLLDLNLPGVNGFEVLQHIRSRQPLRSIRVVILSGSSSMQDVRRANELGVEAYIQKPQEFEDYALVGSRIGTVIERECSKIEPEVREKTESEEG